jgi:hypothetical protein
MKPRKKMDCEVEKDGGKAPRPLWNEAIYTARESRNPISLFSEIWPFRKLRILRNFMIKARVALSPWPV